MKKKPPFRSGSAFTLVELLAVVVILVILVLLAFTGLQASTKRARLADSTAAMKNIGTALSLYASDNGVLPGPLLMRHSPNANSPNHLLGRIWPYMGFTVKPAKDEMPHAFVPRHWSEWAQRTYQKKPGTSVTIYNTPSSVKDREGVNRLTLFGYPGAVDSYPAPWNGIASSAPLATTFIVEDATDTTGEGLSPKAGELQNFRLRLFLDWHIESQKIQ